jgi:hypothetical protein
VALFSDGNRFTEDVSFVRIVESELKLIQIQRQMCLADVVARSNRVALYNDRNSKGRSERNTERNPESRAE